ncbi:MAG TPA: tripartite tricarboxylate transporter substrate binding protein [Alphaproteobacteria bacterium]
MNTIRRSAAALAVMLAVAGPAAAQDKFPSRPVKILVPYGPGGATDILARVMAEGMRQSLGQSFVVENKPGAFGIVALEELARSRADGYTLFVGNVSTNAITPMLFSKKMSFNYADTIIPITRLADLPAFLLATTNDFPPKSVAEFVAYAKQRPGQLKYATVGVASFPHYDMIMFSKKAGLDMIDIPLKGGATEAVTNMAAGEEQVAFLNVATTAPLIKAGHVRPLAAVADNRLADYPDVPTMAEAGYPGIGTQQWQAVFARAGTSKPILDALFKAATAAVKSPQADKIFAPQYIRALPSASLDEAKHWLQEETEAWRKIVAVADLKLD